ncbi:MAG: hypothetical protein HY279_01525 [Nitrospinae bacterium]|nr:hypothetical protein [Nitrospinota bacterium]
MSLIRHILETTTGLRKKHEKRSEARNYTAAYNGTLSLPSQNECFKISLGYLERFLIKANHEKIDSGVSGGTLILDEWIEGCGFFSGRYTLRNGRETIKTGSFSWEGAGNIEDTWDMFTEFE